MSEIRTEMERKILQESQEIQELKSAIERSHSVCERATSIIEGFDLRLVRLETAILPIHGSTQKLSKVHDNIEAALEELEKVIGFFEAAKTEEKLILYSAPTSAAELTAYFEAVDKVRAALSFIIGMKVRDSDALRSEQKSLISKATSKLESLFGKWVTEMAVPKRDELLNLAKSNISVPITEDSFTIPSQYLNVDSLQKICTLAGYLGDFESDMVIHSTSSPNTSYLKTFVDIRSTFINQLFSAFSPNDKKNEIVAGFYQVGSSILLPFSWLLLFASQLEYVLLQRILSSSTGAKSTKKNASRNALETILSSPLTNYVTLVDSLVVKARKAITQSHDFSLTFHILDILSLFFLDLPNDTPLDALKQAGRRGGDFRASLNALISTAFLSFFEFLDNLKNSTSSKSSNLPEDGTVHEITSNCMSVLKRIAEFPEISELILRVLQQLPNWQDFSATGTISTAQSPATETDDLFNKMIIASSTWKQQKNGHLALQKYLTESINALITNLETRAKAYKKTIIGTKEILGAIFMLNNYHFTLKSTRTNSLLSRVLGEPIIRSLEEKMRLEMDVYQDSWKPLLTTLMDATGLKTVLTPGKATTLPKPEKKIIKEKFKTFNAGIEDNLKSQKKYSVPDVELRSHIVRDIKQVLIPVYSKFYERYQNITFTKKPEKYLKYDVQALEAVLTKFFDPNTH